MMDGIYKWIAGGKTKESVKDRCKECKVKDSEELENYVRDIVYEF